MLEWEGDRQERCRLSRSIHAAISRLLAASVGADAAGKGKVREGERARGRGRTEGCGVVVVWVPGLLLLCLLRCAVILQWPAAHCSLFCRVFWACPLAGNLSCGPSLPPFPSPLLHHPTLFIALPYRTRSLQAARACQGQIHLCCFGYFTSLSTLRTVVGRASRQPAQGSKPTPIQTPGQDAKGACATRVRWPSSRIPIPPPKDTAGCVYLVPAALQA